MSSQVNLIEMLGQYVRSMIDKSFILSYRIDQYLGKLCKEIEDVHHDRLPPHYRSHRIFHIVYGIAWHVYLALDKTMPAHWRFVGIDFFYLSSGTTSLWILQLVFGIIYVPLVYYYYVLLWRNPREVRQYCRYLLNKYYPKDANNNMPKAMKTLKLFTSNLLAIVSLARLGTAFIPVLFMLQNWWLILPNSSGIVWPVFVRDTLLCVLNYYSHYVRVNMMVYIFMASIVNMFLYDGIIRIKFKQMNGTLNGQNGNPVMATKRYMASFHEMLSFVRRYDDIFGRLYCSFAYGITPLTVLAIISLSSNNEHSLWIKQLFYAIYYGCAIGCFFPQYMFSNYSTLLHRRYHRFSLLRQQIDTKHVSICFLWKTLRMVESLGGPRLGMTYIFMNTTMTANTLYKFLVTYVQLVIIFYSSVKGY